MEPYRPEPVTIAVCTYFICKKKKLQLHLQPKNTSYLYPLISNEFGEGSADQNNGSTDGSINGSPLWRTLVQKHEESNVKASFILWMISTLHAKSRSRQQELRFKIKVLLKTNA